MNSIYCLRCGVENPSSHMLCSKCGTPLGDKTEPPRGLGIEAAAAGRRSSAFDRLPPSFQVEPFSPSKHATRGYPALRFLAAVNTFLAYTVMLVGCLIGGFLLLAPALPQPQNTVAAVLAFSVAAGVFLYFLLIAEGIAVVVDLEANTRRIVHLLEKSSD